MPSGQGAEEPALRDAWRFDPDEDRWDPLPPLPSPREGLAAAAIGGVIYAVGGELGSASTAQATLEAFDVLTLRWERLPPMPTPRGGLAAAAFGGRLHVVGG
jgi:hypothetical protein